MLITTSKELKVKKKKQIFFPCVYYSEKIKGRESIQWP